MAFSVKRTKFAFVLLILQVVFLILFGLMVEYDDSASARHPPNSLDHDKGGADPHANEISHLYPMFQDVHVMIFIGFGFLMTFLKRYGYGSISFNMLVAAFVLEWALLMGGFLEMSDSKIKISIESLLIADFSAAAVLISFGAVLGKTSPLQLIVMAFLEIVVFKGNEFLGLHIFKAVDVGGSMFVHAFGAYFGLAVARVLYREDCESDKEGSIYHSDLFSMIGTVFLWLYWPSFNAALAPGDDQHRAVINTYLALAAACIVAIAVSALVSNENKIDMVHVQNATLAGGVAVGTSADMMIHPWGAMLIGSLAGALSSIGFRFITPFLATKLKIHDTCGVNNLHGMPGILAGIVGTVAAALATTNNYGKSLYQIFPARAPANGSELLDINMELAGVEGGDGRTAGLQAGFQMVALAVTLVLAIVSGLIVGFVLRLPFFDQPKGQFVYDDSPWWSTPNDFNAETEVLAMKNKPDKLIVAADTHKGGQEESPM